ncbi:MAG TPA: lysophospholipid acyltransferase family protein [Limnochordia bacterium]
MHRGRLYGRLRLLARGLGACGFRWRVEGADHVPARGPVIVAGNHVSLLDPVLIGATCHRPIEFMAKRELFAYPVLGRLLHHLGAFPVDRSRPGRTPLQRAIDILQSGGAVGIFPEGKRNHHTSLFPPATGVGWLAIRTRCPVVPVALSGFDPSTMWCWPIRGRLRVRYGPPLSFPPERYPRTDRLWRLAATDDVVRALRALLDEPVVLAPPSRQGGLS